jgi:PhzF family phenazine biosynthesis protein
LSVDLVQIDAFTDRPFAGNPAGVCVLDEEPVDEWMQAVANEMNISETAFLVADRSRADHWSLRWFTPEVEVDLCGHATLACAHHLFETGAAHGDRLVFATRSGELVATRGAEGWIALDFPADPTVITEPPAGLLPALGIDDGLVATAKGANYYLVELASADHVRSLTPDFSALKRVEARATIVTSAGDGMHDIVSRVFGPRVGIDEDPVTGSAHCTLGCYWSPKLAKSYLLAYQASARGGVLRVMLRDDRVVLEGRAVTVFGAELAEPAKAGSPAVSR